MSDLNDNLLGEQNQTADPKAFEQRKNEIDPKKVVIKTAEPHNHDEAHVHVDKSGHKDLYKPKAGGGEDKALRKLWTIFGVCCIFIVAEVVGGLIAGSLAILSDAVHLGSDLVGFLFSIVAINLSKMDATVVFTYGYARAQIIGALSSTMLVIVLSLWLVYEATSRMIAGVQPIEPWIMFGTAIFGLICNLSMFKVLHSTGDHSDHDHGHDHGHGHSHGDNDEHSHGDKDEHAHGDKDGHNHDDKHEHKVVKKKEIKDVNISAAAAHVMADIIQSIGVVLAAVVILIFPNAVIVDPICTIVFALGSCYTTFGTITKCIRCLMEGVPKNINYNEIKKNISELPNVHKIEDLHIWSVVAGKPCATCHIIYTGESRSEDVLNAVT